MKDLNLLWCFMYDDLGALCYALLHPSALHTRSLCWGLTLRACCTLWHREGDQDMAARDRVGHERQAGAKSASNHINRYTPRLHFFTRPLPGCRRLLYHSSPKDAWFRFSNTSLKVASGYLSTPVLSP